MENKTELKKTHATGFGGSDAKMFAKIGFDGIGALSTTNKKRILVALGRREADTFDGNVYTFGGHEFENYMAESLDMEREKYMENEAIKPDTFKVFAHADFWKQENGETTVVECKFVQDETGVVENTYYAQLQWYYMLGADNVILAHGRGNVFPFECLELNVQPVIRDDYYIQQLRDGISILDNAIKNGEFDNLSNETLDVATLDAGEQTAVEKLRDALRVIKDAETVVDALRAQLLAFMEQNGVLNIKGDDFTISYVSPTVRRTFDTKKAQTKFPELKSDEYYKESAVKSSVKITLK